LVIQVSAEGNGKMDLFFNPLSLEFIKRTQIQGANTCVMAARLGARALLVGKVGDDEHGSAYLARLRAEGVSTARVGVAAGFTTGIATILLESASGENQIVIVPGANAALSAQDVADAAADAADCRVVATVLEVGSQCGGPGLEF
jgi:ribokinase